MLKSKIPLHHVQQYKSFTFERDKALDEIYRKCLKRVSDKLRFGFTTSIRAFGDYYSRLINTGNDFAYRSASQTLEHEALNIFDHVSQLVMADVARMRASAYRLTFAGESEALGRVIRKTLRAESQHDVFHRAINNKNNLLKEIDLYFRQLTRKMINIFERSVLLGDTRDEFLTKLYKTIPKQRELNENRRVLSIKQLKEADPIISAKRKFTFDIIEQNEWDKVLTDYLGEFIPSWRGPEILVPGVKIIGEDEAARTAYAWEVERDIMYSYVEIVKQGQVDAANDAGIKEFMWIAVLGPGPKGFYTCDSCMWRDGLTTSEIEEHLKSAHADDYFEAVTPPAHTWCQCRIVPVIGELPEREDDIDLKGFYEWLNP